MALKTVLKVGNFEVKRRVPSKPKPKPKLITLADHGKAPPVKRGPVAGVSGNAPKYGQMDTGEYLTKLDGSAGRSVFDEMRRSDSQVISTLRAMTLPIRQAQYSVEPGSDDSKDVEIAEIIEDNLLRGMTITWDDVIRHALLMLPMGFSPMEKIWEIRDNMLYLRKLDPRLPTSVEGWEYDEKKKRTTAMVQRDSSWHKFTVPMEKLLIFTSDKEGDNWEGTSVLRGAYKGWYIKSALEKINAIKHERYGIGVPVGHLPPNIVEGSKEWDDLKDALEDLYANERSYLMLPDGYDVTLLGMSKESQGTDVLPDLKYYDEAIAKSMLAMFINLGTTATGSRALGGSFIDVFMLSLQSYADYIVEVFNRFLIWEYVASNWGEVENMPLLRVAQIKELDPVVVAELVKANVIEADFDIENAVRGSIHLPEKQEEEEEDPAPKPKPAPVVEDEEIDEDVEPVEAHDHKGGYRFAHRDMTLEELMVDVAAIEHRLNTAQLNLERDILEIKDAQTVDIIRQLVGGRQIQDVRVISKKEMHALLLKEYKKQLRTGRKEAEGEIAAQQVGLKLADPAAFNYDDYLKFINAELAVQTEGAANKLLSILATDSIELQRAGLSGEALEQALKVRAEERISDATWSKMAAGAVNRGWGNGRQLAFKDNADDEDYSYYSAILDGKACSECEPLDGEKHKYGDAKYITPNPNCLGGDFCRCMTIIVMKSESATEAEFERLIGGT